MRKAPVTRLIALAAAGLVATIAAGGMALAASFTDVPARHWAYDEIEWLVANDIARGFPDRTFDPEGYIKRQQAAVWFKNYHDNLGGPVVHWGAHQANGSVIASSPGVSIFPGPPPPGGGVNLIDVKDGRAPVDLRSCAITATLNGTAGTGQVGEILAIGGTGGLTVATYDSAGGRGSSTPIAFSWAAFC